MLCRLMFRWSVDGTSVELWLLHCIVHSNQDFQLKFWNSLRSSETRLTKQKINRKMKNKNKSQTLQILKEPFGDMKTTSWEFAIMIKARDSNFYDELHWYFLSHGAGVNWENFFHWISFIRSKYRWNIRFVSQYGFFFTFKLQKLFFLLDSLLYIQE